MNRPPFLSGLATAGWADMPASAVTPDVVQTSRGVFEFKDGAPTQEMSQTLCDQKDFTFVYAISIPSVEIKRAKKCPYSRREPAG